jgi:hypothetical protein
MLDSETRAWLAGVFSKELSSEDQDRYCKEIFAVVGERPMGELFFELAILNSDAAFCLLGLCHADHHLHLNSRAGIAAGLMQKSLELARLFAAERVQGGRLIQDWTLIQSLLADLHIEAAVAEKLILGEMNPALAFWILKSCDHFVSRCMQVMGGAGYTEDYLIEKIFRQVHILKNSAAPFSKTMMKYYQNEVAKR